jgi:hypothetical protein
MLLDMNAKEWPRFVLLFSLLCILDATLNGCGSGSAGSTASIPATPVEAPAITVQPADQSVPMGLSANFAVTATGSSLKYQWAKNGAAIAGATAGSYATPATAFADTGASFTVSVSNSGGRVTSNAAALTVTARAPLPGDLRFRQVDAASTVNGWGNVGTPLSTDISGRMGQTFYPSIGTPFYVGSYGDCGPTPTTDGLGCAWFFSEYPFTPSSSSASLAAGYAGGFYDEFPTDLQDATWPAMNDLTPASSSSVVNSLDLEPANILFAVSWEQSAQQVGFIREQNTVALADLQAAVMQEGANGRVVTAISNNGGPITYFAYGWQSDTATVYEAQVMTASPSGAAAAAASLAANGYIITATGMADPDNNVLLVGTRVQGDAMPRPFVAAAASQTSTLQQQGFAIVGVINDATQSNQTGYLWER